MKGKTSELIGRALDWAVCVAEGNSPVINPVRFGATRFGMFDSPRGYTIKRYSTDWEHGGPIIEKEKISVEIKPHGYWMGSFQYNYADDKEFLTLGPTPLIAAMRCYCCSKLGDEIDIPEELCQSQNS